MIGSYEVPWTEEQLCKIHWKLELALIGEVIIALLLFANLFIRS